MSASSDNGKSSGALQSIAVAVVIAFVGGGSAPWWWPRVFPDRQTVQTQPSQGTITQTATPTPAPTPPGANIPAGKQPYMGPLEGGTNRAGSDLSSTGIQTNSAQECSDLCAGNDTCKAMTFVKHPDANGGICWMKGAIPSPTANQQMVSATKLYP
jgi:hypothetical protein